MSPEDKMNNPPGLLDQAIVAFIDILGYGELVERLINNLDGIKGIEDVLQKTSVGLIKAMKSMLAIPDAYQEYYRELIRAIDVKFISDTILVTLHLAKTKIPFPDFKQDERLFHCIHLYLRHICMFSTMFIGKTGLVLRGGISMGPHYEKQYDSSIFLFSQAYLNACRLEKEAKFPRILIDKELFAYFKSFPPDDISNFFYDDEGEKCLNVYAHFDRVASSHSILRDIRTGIIRNIVQNDRKKRALENLLYFSKFHNRRVLLLGFDDLLINVSKIEQRFHSL